MIRDDKVTIRIESQLLNKIKKKAERKGQTTSTLIGDLLKDGMSNELRHPCIITTGNTYMWFSPLGTYGSLDSNSYKRFCNNALAINGEEWDNLGKTMNEAIESIGGEVVCEFMDIGILIKKLDLFTEINNEYGNKKDTL